MSENFKIFYPIIEQITKFENHCDIYQYYNMAELYLSNQGGLFNLDQFIKILGNSFDFKSVNNKSNVKILKNKLFTYFKSDFGKLFFKHIKNETFTIISNRKILNNLGISKLESNYIYIPIKYLRKKQLFRDVIIGTFLLTCEGYSNDEVAKKFNITKNRIQKATARNNEGEIKKIFRFNVTECKDFKDACEKRNKLWIGNGIVTKIKKRNNKIFLCCYRTNRYESSLPFHKVRIKESAGEHAKDRKYIKVFEEKLKFKNEKGKKFTLFLPKKNSEEPDFFKFNEYPKKKNKFSNFNGWDLDKYVQEYSIYNA
jgi:hypothetical protein